MKILVKYEIDNCKECPYCTLTGKKREEYSCLLNGDILDDTSAINNNCFFKNKQDRFLREE